MDRLPPELLALLMGGGPPPPPGGPVPPDLMAGGGVPPMGPGMGGPPPELLAAMMGGGAPPGMPPGMPPEMAGGPPGLPPELAAMMGGPPPGPPMPPPAMPPPLSQTLGVVPTLPPPPDVLAAMEAGPPPEEMAAPLGPAGFAEGEDDAEEDTGPIYPWWYDPKQEPRPTLRMAEEAARAKREEYAEYIDRVKDDIERVTLKRVGVFRDFTEDAEEPFQSPMIANEVNLGATYMGSIPVTYKPVWVNPNDLDEAERKADLLHAVRRSAIRQHSRAGNGLLSRDEAMMVMLYGRVCSMSVIDLDDPDHIIRHELLDPTTCFPTFEGSRGLSQMVRVYETTVDALNGAFGGKRNKVRRVFLNEQRKGDGETPVWDGTQRVTVIELWNRTWRGVFAGGHTISVEKHDYGFVPFVYKLGGLGLPGIVTDPNISEASPEGFGMGASRVDRGRTIAEQGVAHFHFQKATHDQKEAVLGALYTEISKAANPSLIVTQGPYSQEQGAPRLSPRKGARNLLRDDETAEVYPTAPAPVATQPIMQALAQDLATGFAAPVEYGNDPGGSSNASIQGLAEISRGRFTVHLATLEEYHAEVAEMWLRELRDWGHLVGEEGQKGVFVVPASDVALGRPTAFELTVEDLRSTGIHVDARMEHVPPSLLTQLGSAARVWNEMGAMTVREAIELRGGKNPRRVMDEWVVEEAMKSDLAKDIRLLDAIAARGDPDLYAKIRERLGQAESGGGGQPPPYGTPGTDQSPQAGIAGAGTNPMIGVGPFPGAGQPPGPNGPPAVPGAVPPTMM